MDYSNILVFLISFFLAFLVQKIFIKNKKFDDFNFRSSHNTLATKTGGISVFLTIFIISIYNYINTIEIFDFSLFIPLSIMFIVGVYDDFYNADFKLKFLLQIIVAKIIIDQGYVITNYYGLFNMYEVSWIIAQITTVFVFLIIINSFNFIDGVDGLAISQVIKTILLIEFFNESLSPLVSLSLILIVSLLPLYYFNFKKKKKIFLGDAGSLFLGTLIAIYIFHLLGDNYTIKKEFSINKVLFSVLVVLYPLIDLLRVFVLRIKSGVSPFTADQRHLHHVILKQVSSKHAIVCLIILIIELCFFCLLMTLFAT